MKYNLRVHNKLLLDDCSMCCFNRDGNCKLCTILNELKQERPKVMCYDFKHAHFMRLIELSTNIKIL